LLEAGAELSTSHGNTCSGGRYLIINADVSLDALREAMRVPDIARFNEAHPASTYAATPPVIEAYEPLRIAGPA
jgi:hypothetical protein